MSTQQLKKDPSMDEILASIREIISEDVKSISTAKPLAPPKRVINTHVSHGTEDVLDLTDAVDDDSSRTTTLYNNQKKRGGFMTYSAGPKQDEALELSDEVSIREEIEEQPTNTPSKRSPKRTHEIEEVVNLEISEKIRETLSESDMISADALAQSSEALRALNDLNTGQDFASSLPSKIEGSQTIEELMSVLLRPMLKNWLDANLPSIVKVIVSEQIEKVMKQRLK